MMTAAVVGAKVAEQRVHDAFWNIIAAVVAIIVIIFSLFQFRLFSQCLHLL